MLILMISRPSLKLGYLGSKTRSPGQINGKPYLHCSSYIFEAIIMNLAQNIFMPLLPMAGVGHIVFGCDATFVYAYVRMCVCHVRNQVQVYLQV